LKTDEVLERKVLEKSLNNNPSIVKSSVKCEAMYYKWGVLQIGYKQVYVIILSAAFYSVQCFWALLCVALQSKFWCTECRIWLSIYIFDAWKLPVLVLESPWIWHFECSMNPVGITFSPTLAFRMEHPGQSVNAILKAVAWASFSLICMFW